MAEYLIQDTTLTELADAIRERNNTAETIPVADMARQIREGKESHVDTKTLTDWTYWFIYGARANTAESIDTSNGTVFDGFFASCSADMFPNGYPFDKINTSNGISFNSFLLSCKDITELSPYFVDVSNAEDLQSFFWQCSNLKTVPQLNTSKCKDFYGFCRECALLEEVPQLDTSNGTNFGYMFRNCQTLKTVPQFDTSKGTNFIYMFDTCYDLIEIPTLNTSNGTQFDNMCANCTRVVTIGKLDLTKAESISNLFRNDYALETLAGLTFNSMPTTKLANIFYKDTKLKNITITGTIKVDSNDLNLAHCSNLTVDSMLSILNSLEDNTGKTTQYTVYFGSTNLAKLTDEQKAIAVNKNISLG